MLGVINGIDIFKRDFNSVDDINKTIFDYIDYCCDGVSLNSETSLKVKRVKLIVDIFYDNASYSWPAYRYNAQNERHKHEVLLSSHVLNLLYAFEILCDKPCKRAAVKVNMVLDIVIHDLGKVVSRYFSGRAFIAKHAIHKDFNEILDLKEFMHADTCNGHMLLSKITAELFGIPNYSSYLHHNTDKLELTNNGKLVHLIESTSNTEKLEELKTMIRNIFGQVCDREILRLNFSKVKTEKRDITESYYCITNLNIVKAIDNFKNMYYGRQEMVELYGTDENIKLKIESMQLEIMNHIGNNKELNTRINKIPKIIQKLFGAFN